MNTKDFKNAQVGQIIDGEMVKYVNRSLYGAKIITKKNGFYNLYTMPNVAPDEVFTSEARFNLLTEN